MNFEIPGDPLSKGPWFYHVYDEVSETPYVPYAGIRAGNSTPVKDFCERSPAEGAVREVLDHLDWQFPGKTRFISLWDDYERAVKEANRRREQPRPWDPRSRTCQDRGDVGIAVISARQLLAREIECFNVRDYLMFYQPDIIIRNNVKQNYPISPGEWLAVSRIPDQAVICTMDFTGGRIH
ncbi:hypothetical protein QBC43DRAFT_66866 [Cladorrhinum sp. PSN259]|nr:hypothetical protein QBC43DRAFT_66866 [Cladorrhinum sp. PSN259]